MKKIIVAIAVSMLFCAKAHADSFEPDLTYQVIIDTVTQIVNTVSTGVVPGATQMDSPQVKERAGVDIQNIDASANIWCLIISTTPTVNNAWKITPGNHLYIGLRDVIGFSQGKTTTAPIYCLSDGAASTKAITTQVK